MRGIGAGQSRLRLAERLDRFLACCDNQGRALVVEVGCGDGKGTAVLRERLIHRWGAAGFCLVSLDIDLGPIGSAQRRFRGDGLSDVRLLAADLYALPLPLSSTDCLVALNVGYLINRGAFFSEAVRILAPGGKVLLYDLISVGRKTQRLLFSMSLTREQLARRNPAAGAA